MSFLYPRTIAVDRPAAETDPGVTEYGYLARADEAPQLAGLPCSIQQRATAGQTGAQLPSDTRANTAWRIFIPLRALRDPTAIQPNDVVIDDLGRRFQVTAAYFNSLGFNLLTEHVKV